MGSRGGGTVGKGAGSIGLSGEGLQHRKDPRPNQK